MKQLITPVKDSRFATPVKAGLQGPRIVNIHPRCIYIHTKY